MRNALKFVLFVVVLFATLGAFVGCGQEDTRGFVVKVDYGVTVEHAFARVGFHDVDPVILEITAGEGEGIQKVEMQDLPLPVIIDEYLTLQELKWFVEDEGFQVPNLREALAYLEQYGRKDEYVLPGAVLDVRDDGQCVVVVDMLSLSVTCGEQERFGGYSTKVPVVYPEE